MSKILCRYWYGLLIGLLILSATGCDGEHSRLNNNDPAPSFKLEQLRPGQLAFPADAQGKVVAIRFWADWCPFCAEEMSSIEKIYQRKKDQGLVILAVNVGQSRQVAERFAKRVGISYPVLLDPDSTVAESYGVIGFPTTFLVSRDGRVRSKILGESEAHVFEKMVDDLL